MDDARMYALCEHKEEPYSIDEIVAYCTSFGKAVALQESLASGRFYLICIDGDELAHLLAPLMMRQMQTTIRSATASGKF